MKTLAIRIIIEKITGTKLGRASNIVSVLGSSSYVKIDHNLELIVILHTYFHGSN